MLYKVAALTAFTACVAASLDHNKRAPSDALAAFVEQERQISFNGALNNIGGFNSGLVPGAEPGVVVASPSNQNPDYYYFWLRDGSLTYAMIVDELIFGNLTLQKTIEDFTHSQAELQTVSNPSGSFWPAGLNLGEPKYYTNLTRFNGDWGRPQRDGPALRSIVFINLCQALIANNKTSVAKTVYWPLILNDLKYVGMYFNSTGYDLWEEVHGNSLFTTAAQHRALASGATLAKQLGVPCKPCQQAPNVLCFLENSFWNASGQYLTADVNVNNVDRSGINNDPLLAAIHSFDPSATCDAPGYQPCNSKILATHKVFVDSFRSLYPINKNKTAGPTGGILVGRYPEDTYSGIVGNTGGNPWYICTLAAAELLYDAAAQINTTGQLMVDNTSFAFFKDIFPDVRVNTVYTGDAMGQIVQAMQAYGDSFVAAVQQFTPQNGSLSEQINGTTGTPTSAYDLTWSFAAFVTMARRREGLFPLPWGVMNVTNSTGTCQGSTYNATGTFSPARAAGAPMIKKACMTEVLFTVNATTSFGQNIYLVGNTTLLGGAVNNKKTVILPCNPGNYTSTRNEWFVDIWLPAGVPVKYQFVNQQSNGTLIFENTTRVVHPSECGGELVMTNDVASFPGLPAS